MTTVRPGIWYETLEWTSGGGGLKEEKKKEEEEDEEDDGDEDEEEHDEHEYEEKWTEEEEVEKIVKGRDGKYKKWKQNWFNPSKGDTGLHDNDDDEWMSGGGRGREDEE